MLRGHCCCLTGCAAGVSQHKCHRNLLAGLLQSEENCAYAHDAWRRETVVCPAELPPEVFPKPIRAVEATTPNGACTLRVRAVPLPAAVAMALDQNADLLARLSTSTSASGSGASSSEAPTAAVSNGVAHAGAAGGSGGGAEEGESLEAFGARLATLAHEEGSDAKLAALFKVCQIF